MLKITLAVVRHEQCKHFDGTDVIRLDIVGQRYIIGRLVGGDSAYLTEHTHRVVRLAAVASVVEVHNGHAIVERLYRAKHGHGELLIYDVEINGLARCNIVYSAALIDNNFSFRNAYLLYARQYRREQSACCHYELTAPFSVIRYALLSTLRYRIVGQGDCAVEITENYLIFHILNNIYIITLKVKPSRYMV